MASEKAFSSPVVALLSEMTVEHPADYVPLIVSIFGTVVGEKDHKKAAFGLLYHNSTVTRHLRLAKTIIKGKNVTCNVPELLGVLEAMQSAIEWGEGRIVVRSRKRYLVDGIAKYCNRPARDRRIIRPHENLWVSMEDMSEILAISAIHIDSWMADAYICRSRDEAEQALTCARSRMSLPELLPAAIFIRIVDEEGSILTDRVALEELDGASTPELKRKVQQRNPQSVSVTDFVTESGKYGLSSREDRLSKRAARKSPDREIGLVRAAPCPETPPKHDTASNLHVSDDETRYLSPIGSAQLSPPRTPIVKIETPSQPLFVIEVAEDTPPMQLV